MTSATCSRKPCRFSNSSSALTSSLRFSSRPAASGASRPATCRCSRSRRGCVSASSTWSPPSRTAACQRSKSATSAPSAARARAGRPPSASDQAGGVEQADAVVAGDAVQLLHRLVADAALGRVDDALEGEVVVGRDGDAEVGHGVADLQALVEARAADHPVGQADGQEPVLEGAHLVGGAHQDGDAVGRDRVEAAGAAGERLDLLADPARLLLAVPVADQPDLLARGDARSRGSCRAGSRSRRSRPEAAARMCGVER